eukprot:CAMPEP_0175986634 /NCGR_PEP_ID=MMETSP0108-20121206/50252_1 /TAXON_ID=195067 ORGANISM="Goniomonas pacifica, Strain CCMP1869" /NCGR_SAMPLE_ID=MMETSP0108 /ASSEMBLY_ACC=CAM_ASM_000204 /LENGTH=103 /DNA_ID=CAMNT_0017317801 /DNA_START=445 /DNA_END=756 /DNA_ORIENTATION=-
MMRSTSRTPSLPILRLRRTACIPYSSHSGGAKLTASAQVNPCENPEWNALAQVRTNSPGFWTILYTGIPRLRKADGDTIVVFRLKNSGSSSTAPNSATAAAAV